MLNLNTTLNAVITKVLRNSTRDYVEYILNEETGIFNSRTISRTLTIPDHNLSIFNMAFSDSSFQIKEIRLPNGTLIALGSSIILEGENTPLIVSKFIITTNDIHITCPAGNGHTIITNLTRVSLYVSPAPETVNTTDLNNGKKNNFKDIQAKIEESTKPLKLAGYVHDTNQSLVSFLKNFIEEYNEDFDTVYTGNSHTQTNAGKRRSLGDIFMICKHYYPQCNLHDVIEILYIELPKVFRGLGSLMCRTINKRVWFDYGSPRFSHGDEQDEWGFNQQYYLTKLKEEPKEEPKTATNAILEEVKAKYKVGTKFKSLVSNDTFKVTGNKFFDGIRSIVLIQDDGSRKIVYDKNKKAFAKIVS